MTFFCKNCGHQKDNHSAEGCYFPRCKCDDYDPPAEDYSAKVWSRYTTGEWLMGSA